ncbi:hypothetical protein Poli38472_005802 [Pythium oligandrum]|uniref:Ankyrin repeat protein n=1 Tax=Pythium oligandrum TaxID=41045 RepID=A0A8K1CRN2_PYTOL|nr:hypothetical protein Poli38472_005802 [Pythium oligandrum]|eukprot:TMW68334.1 hypothetical protein Poli38472_005802 [Pythium oligandrum]
MQRPEAVEVTMLLLEHGAVTQWNYKGEHSALTVAAETGSFELFMVVLAHEGKSAIRPEALSHSLLSACSSRRGAEIVQYLLELGASTAVKSIQVGDTVLHKACMTGNAVLVKLLLAQGADPNAANYSGYTTLHTACVNKDSDEVVQLLLDRGVDVNKQVAGITALVNASSSGAVKTVEKLLAYGADTTISREDGKTALHCACSQGAPEVVRLLLEHGVDPNLRDVSGNTPLHVAALEERSAVVKVLGQRGADVHARNEDGFTPLTMCVRWDKCEAMQFRQNPVYALETVYELMKFGAVYEDSPMNCPDIFQGMSTTRPGTEDDWILYSEVVASVPICIRYWTAQREAGKPLTQIPSGVAGNGCSAVQNFLDQTICQ